MPSSSEDLHPSAGARFVFTREASTAMDAGADLELARLRYAVAAHLADGRTLSATLSWDERGQARLDPGWPDAWAHEEALKLARVLKTDPKRRLLRWRGPT
jgi:hypothetical protein